MKTSFQKWIEIGILKEFQDYAKKIPKSGPAASSKDNMDCIKQRPKFKTCVGVDEATCKPCLVLKPKATAVSFYQYLPKKRISGFQINPLFFLKTSMGYCTDVVGATE